VTSGATPQREAGRRGRGHPSSMSKRSPPRSKRRPTSDARRSPSANHRRSRRRSPREGEALPDSRQAPRSRALGPVGSPNWAAARSLTGRGMRTAPSRSRRAKRLASWAARWALSPPGRRVRRWRCQPRGKGRTPGPAHGDGRTQAVSPLHLRPRRARC